MSRHDGLLLVPCPLCDGYAAVGRAIWVYAAGCGFPHEDVEEDECPECEGNGRVLIEGELIAESDLAEMCDP